MEKLGKQLAKQLKLEVLVVFLAVFVALKELFFKAPFLKAFFVAIGKNHFLRCWFFKNIFPSWIA